MVSTSARALVRAVYQTTIQPSAFAFSRFYNETAYPFTKPAPNAPSPTPTKVDSASPYPFTKPSAPTKIATPTRPTERPGPNQDDSAVISREAKADAHGHGPDYNVALDYRTSSVELATELKDCTNQPSSFTPIPLRVMDGSEDTDNTAAAVLSGAPTELQARTVRSDNIFKPAKTATQSGDWHGHHWRMDWDVLGKGHRWENPLMGWQSSADMMQGTHLNFKSKDDAIRFAEKQGYEFFVQEPNERRIVPKAYATQFVHSPKKLKEVRTK